MRNQRLLNQMTHSGISCAQLAAVVEVDPKTVDRWVNQGRLPHRRHRQRAAEALQTTERDLWPELLSHETLSDDPTGIIHVYSSRNDVPPDLWRQLANGARQEVNLLVYAGLFLLDSHPELVGEPANAVDRPQVRILIASADSAAAAQRAQEEDDDAHLGARIELSRATLRAAVRCQHVEAREHDTTLYNSIYRFDDDMLVNTHTFGSRAPSNPVLHIRRSGGTLFDHYLTSFERVWAGATSLAPDGRA